MESMVNLFWFSFILLSAIVFLLSESTVLNLICLFTYTLSMSVLYYLKVMNFWMLGLVMIVVLTGLFLIFTYMSSVTPESPELNKSMNSFSFVACLFMMLILMMWFLHTFPLTEHSSLVFISSSVEVCNSVNKHSSNMVISLFLIALLLLLVILFMRFTYNKGGGLRKKF